jgi:hypothetical protein
MREHLISIPEELYQEAERIAQETARSVDEVIVSRLKRSLRPSCLDLPDDEQEELKALAYLSDDALWTIARAQMPQKSQSIMQDLMRKNSLGTISNSEKIELTQLVEDGQRLTLRKAEAMRLLIQRGHVITLDDLAPD